MYTDRELVDGVLNNNEVLILHLFLDKCAPILQYIKWHVFDGKMEMSELINELYLYLNADNWRRLRQFDHSYRLTAYILVIAIRFFWKKRAGMIVNEPVEDIPHELCTEYNEERIHQKIDTKSLINRLSNKRYRSVLRKLILEDMDPQELADEMKITVANLYNIKRRAIQKIARIMGEEKNYL